MSLRMTSLIAGICPPLCAQSLSRPASNFSPNNQFAWSPFHRSKRQVWFPPSATLDAVSEVDLPTSNCFCPEPERSCALPDIAKSSTQVDSDVTKALYDWCSSMTDSSWVNRLKQVFEEARCEAQTYSSLHDSSSKELAELRTTVANLQAENYHSKTCLGSGLRRHPHWVDVTFPRTSRANCQSAEPNSSTETGGRSVLTQTIFQSSHLQILTKMIRRMIHLTVPGASTPQLTLPPSLQAPTHFSNSYTPLKIPIQMAPKSAKKLGLYLFSAQSNESL